MRGRLRDTLPEMRGCLLLLQLFCCTRILCAQWVNYPTPGLPRTKDGRPNLSANVPRPSDKHPNLSGVWASILPPRQVPESHYGEPTFMNMENFLAPGSSLNMLAPALALFQEHSRVFGADRPSEKCLPHGIPDAMVIPGAPTKIVQMPGLTLILYEEFARFRQIFTDGRPFPADLNPAWLGSSIGRWEGETFVVETAGFNDKTWLDDVGHPHSNALRTTERFHRVDVGHMELEINFNDPKYYAKPWTTRMRFALMPDTDLIEDVCDNEKDNAHTVR
jgi:hypothetical protein